MEGAFKRKLPIDAPQFCSDLLAIETAIEHQHIRFWLLERKLSVYRAPQLPLPKVVPMVAVGGVIAL